MKLTTALTAALIVAATAASAGTRIERANVALENGVSADGFKLFGYGITPFAEAQYADADFVADDVVILPEGVSAENLDQVVAYLTSIGITGYDVVKRCQGGEKRLSNTDIDGNGQLDDYVSTSKQCKW